MEILRPDTLHEALELKAAHPGARPIAGGTDLMVELNFDRTRPGEILDLTRVPELVTGPKRNALAEDELIAAFHIAPADGPQQFSKIGTRNAMVIAVCSLSVHLWPGE